MLSMKLLDNMCPTFSIHLHARVVGANANNGKYNVSGNKLQVQEVNRMHKRDKNHKWT